MRLSEAIRLGAMLKPQGFNGWTDEDRTCALAAAGEAAGVEECFDCVYQRRGVCYPALERRFPLLREEVIDPTMHERHTMSVVIWRLNDKARWTREQIADWVETVESARQPADASAPASDAVREEIASPVVSTRA